MASDKKSKMISLRVTQKQYDALAELAYRIRMETGFKITRASIVLKLMEYGLPHLEQEFPEESKKSAS